VTGYHTLQEWTRADDTAWELELMEGVILLSVVKEGGTGLSLERDGPKARSSANPRNHQIELDESNGYSNPS